MVDLEVVLKTEIVVLAVIMEVVLVDRPHLPPLVGVIIVVKVVMFHIVALNQRLKRHATIVVNRDTSAVTGTS